MCKKVRRESLSCQHIPTVAFICNDASYRTRIPFGISQLGFTPILGQKLCNLGKGKAIQIQVINDSNRLCLTFIYHKISILVLIISQQCRRQKQTSAEPPVNRPVHNNRLGMRFLFSHRCQNGQNHTAIAVQCINIVGLKFHTHGRVKIFQRFNDRKAVHNVSGKTGDGLCKNQVYLSCLTVFNQLLHSFAMLQRSSADALIIVNSNELPSRLCLYVLSIVIFLKFIRGCLLVIVSGNTDISRNTPNRGTFSKPLHCLCRDDLQFRSIHALIPVSDFLLAVYRLCSTVSHVLPLILPALCSKTIGASSDNFGCRVLFSYFLLSCD